MDPKLQQKLLIGGGVFACVLGALVLDAVKPGSNSLDRLLAALPLVVGGLGIGWGAFNKPGQGQ